MPGSDFAVFFELFPEPCLLLGADGEVRAANAAFVGLSGQVPVVGLPVEVLIIPTDRGALRQALVRVAQGQSGVTVSAALQGVAGRTDWTLRNGAGSVQAFLHHAPTGALSPDQLGGLLDRAARAEKDQLESTLDALPDLLLVLGPDGRFLGFHAPEKIRPAVPPEDFIGRTPEEVLPEVAPYARQAMAEVDAKGSLTGLRYSLTEPGGSTRWFEISAAPRQGREKGYVFLLRDVTDRVTDACELDYRARLLDALFRLSPLGITLHDAEKKVILDANPAFLTMARRSKDQVIGQHLDTYFLKNSAARAEGQQQLAETGRFGPAVVDIVRGDGSTFSGRLSGVMMVEPASGRRLIWTMIEDVTEDVRTRDRLRLAEARAVDARRQLMIAVDALADGFIMVDADDRVVMTNASYRRIYQADEGLCCPGTAFADIVRSTVKKGMVLDGIGREEAFFNERMARHRAPQSDFEQRLDDGRVVRIHEHVLPDGGRVGLHVIVTDLYRAREAAEEASRAKSAFLAHMGHEIRTPLAGILGMTELLIDRLHEADQLRLALAVQQSGETLLTILNDLLDMSKIEAGKLELDNRTFAPVDLARSVAALYEMRSESKGLDFKLELGPGADRLRHGDAHRISQILHNLLSNALKFTAEGGISLSLDASDGGDVVFTVADTGIGMTPEQTDRMLKPFEQADVSTSRRYGGTGLGMSIVASLIDMMGGSLEVKSRFGAGTCITVRLPLPLVGAAAGGALATDPILSDEDLAGLRVLAADDNAINRAMLQAWLERLGAEVMIVDDGQQALEAWEAGQFDLICLDISMPVLDGISALDLIRAKAQAQGVEPPPAVAITSNAMTHQIAQYIAAGFAAHLAKPFRRDDLVRVLGGLVPPAKRKARLTAAI